MRHRFFILLLPFSFLVAHVNGNDRFFQEISTVFTPADGLPEIIVLNIRTSESGNIIASSAEQEFIYDGEIWRIFPASSDKAAKKKKEFKEDVLWEKQ